MKNALAVYTSKSSLKGPKLVSLAETYGIQLRFMALGGCIPGNPSEIQTKSLALAYGGALLIIGAFESDSETLAQFDQLIELGDKAPITTMLNGGKLPWCELYTSRFNYEKTIKAKPKDKDKIDGSVQKEQLPALQTAKTRYIIYNQSRKKNGGQLMAQLADALAAETDGVIADYQRPSR